MLNILLLRNLISGLCKYPTDYIISYWLHNILLDSPFASHRNILLCELSEINVIECTRTPKYTLHVCICHTPCRHLILLFFIIIYIGWSNMLDICWSICFSWFDCYYWCFKIQKCRSWSLCGKSLAHCVLKSANALSLSCQIFGVAATILIALNAVFALRTWRTHENGRKGSVAIFFI